MSTFAQLLTDYVRRSGISDAELARAVGVGRQTIFRWKEGLVERPRHRQDVLLLAQKLRLTPAERDLLLAAAGFAAVDAPPQPPSVPVAETDEAEAAAGSSSPAAETALPRRGRLSRLPLLTLLILGAALAAAGLRWLEPAAMIPTPAPAPTTPPATPAPTAEPGSTLILVADFANYAPDARYNLAGRISEALAAEIPDPLAESVTVSPWPETVRNPVQAERLLATTDAAMLVWGEYDSGRVRINLTLPDTQTAWERLLPSPAELTSTINVEAPREARILALMALGRIYRSRGELDRAQAAFEGALALDPAQTDTTASLSFYLATVIEDAGDEAITHALGLYTQAAALRPDWINVRYNRGRSYLNRYFRSSAAAADLEAAIEDLTWVIGRRPAFAAAFLNRGLAYYERRLEGDPPRALRDLDRAVALDPESARGYYNRGLVRLRSGDDGWLADFEKALALAPDYAPAYNGLCWAYALSETPQAALPHCDRAAALEADETLLEGRSIAYARLGRREEAAADLAAYLEWVRRQPPALTAYLHGPQAERWLAEIAAGRDPFDPATLTGLK